MASHIGRTLVQSSDQQQSSSNYQVGPFHFGGDTWFLNLFIVIPSIVFLIATLAWIIALECTKRRLRKMLPEAEVKI